MFMSPKMEIRFSKYVFAKNIKINNFIDLGFLFHRKNHQYVVWKPICLQYLVHSECNYINQSYLEFVLHWHWHGFLKWRKSSLILDCFTRYNPSFIRLFAEISPSRSVYEVTPWWCCSYNHPYDYDDHLHLHNMPINCIYPDWTDYLLYAYHDSCFHWFFQSPFDSSLSI